MTVGLALLQAALTIATAGPATAPEYLPLWVARAEGYFTAEGLAVDIQSTRAETGAAEALARGQVELAATSIGAALLVGHTGGKPPKVVFGLTAAPPVALLIAAPRRDEITGLADLIGRDVGVPAPGTPADFGLLSMLAVADIPVPRVTIKSYGDRGLVAALETGRAAAGVIGDPYATRLLEEDKASVLADLRKRGEAARWLGGPTVHAAIFAPAKTKLSDTELRALARALQRAVKRIETAEPEDLQAKLPAAVVGFPQEFAIRVQGAREIYLPDGLVTPEMLEASIRLVRNRLPIPARVKIPRSLDDLLPPEPLLEPTPR